MTPKMELTIMGNPKGKGRPKFSNFGGFVKTYTPKETNSYENLVRMNYKNKYGDHMVVKNSDTEMYVIINAYFSIPSSKPKIVKEKMEDCAVKPISKPDTDNIAKIILDALNGVAYHDDSRVVHLEVNKYYAVEPRVQVILFTKEED